MDIPETILKLEEAKFFLRHLQEAQQIALNNERRVPHNYASQFVITNEPQAFRYYFSAFISAARSVSFVMHKEQPDAYPEYMDRWLAGLCEDDQNFLKRMIKTRNITQKEGSPLEVQKKPLPLAPHSGQVVWDPKDEEGSFTKEREELGMPNWAIGWSYVPEWYFKDKRRVIDECQRYLTLLESFIAYYTNRSEGPSESR